MARVVFAPEMLAYTSGEAELEVSATSYRAAIVAVKQRYPELDDALLSRFAVAIDDTVINSPLLETLAPDSELIFVPKISGG